jgi:hypothetical protein
MFDDDGRGGAPGAAAAHMACELIRALILLKPVSSQRTAASMREKVIKHQYIGLCGMDERR